MIFLTMLAIPLLIALSLFLLGHKKISLAEFLIHISVQCAVAGASIGIIYHRDTYDVEVWNGRIASKAREKVSCSHSYRCNCYTTCSGSGKTRSCSTHCSTCYEHSYDVDWPIYTTLNERIEIDRVNRQGTEEPARWTRAQIGEPTSTLHSYTNYIKAAPDTLFRKQGSSEAMKELYPSKVYDYHRLDRVTGNYGLSMPDLKDWNLRLSDINAELGKAKQVNIVLVLTTDKPSNYAEALEQHWLGGKKNDVIVIVDVDKTTKEIKWAYAMAWTDATLMKVKIRDAILDTKVLDRDKLFDVIKTNVSEFYIRKSMKDFEYLAASITPTATEYTVSVIIGIIVSIGLGIFFWRNDDIAFNFEREHKNNRYGGFR